MKKFYDAPQCQTVWMNGEDLLTASTPVTPTFIEDEVGSFDNGITFTWN
jgi:hypothetical protein